MKRTAVVVCVLVILMLTGCGKKAEPASVSLPDHAISQDGYYVNLPRDIQWDLYPEMDMEISFLVLTQEEPGDDADYFDMELFGRSVLWQTQTDEFPLWLYQTYRGLDWEKLGALQEKAERGDAAAQQEFEAYGDSFRADYEALTPEDIPKICGSLVTVRAQSGHEEGRRLCEAPVRMGEKQENIPVGKLNLHGVNLNESLPPVDEEVKMERQETIWTVYWSDRTPLPEITVPPAEEDWTWTGLSCLGEDITLTDIQVTFSNGTQESWDGKTPLTIPAGKSVIITGTLHHGGNGVLGYCGDCYLVISQEAGEKQQRLWFPMSLTQEWNIYELYAMVEDGLDLTAYYAYAYGYTQPVSPSQEGKAVRGFHGVTLREDADLKVEAVAVSGDDFAYTITLRGENRSDMEQVFDILGWAFNGYRFGGTSREFTVPAGETVQAQFAFPWETLNHWGIAATSPEDIGEVWIFTMEEGQFQDYSFSPTGKKIQENPAGELLEQGADYALYYMDSTVEAPCPLSEVQGESRYCLALLLENNSAERRNYALTLTTINGKICTYTDCATLSPMCSTVIYVEVDYQRMGLSGKKVENVTFTLDWQDNFGNSLAWEEVAVHPEYSLPEEA